LNSKYEQTLDKNFDRALELCSNSYSYEDLIEFLKSGNIPEKQYAALEIPALKSEKDAGIFLSNLVNCDGKIREAIAHKFFEFINNKTYRDYFSKYPAILAQSTIDINANISRMVIDGLYYLKDYKEFGQSYTQQLLEYIDEAFCALDKIIYKDKKYTINKQMFKLYWCLEGLYNYSDYVPQKILFSVLKKSYAQSEYTVREKAAGLIIKNIKYPDFKILAQDIKNDDNYYVRNLSKK